MITFWGSVWKSSTAQITGFSHNILFYQPPVGIVTLIVTYQWFQKRVFQRNFLQVLDDFPLLLNRKQRPKSLDIDATDREYNNAGGVQALELAELTKNEVFDPSVGKLIINSSCRPRESRSQCASRLVGTVMEYRERMENITSDADKHLVALLELRALDALLRCLRDEDLLPTTDKLRNMKESWEYKLNNWSTSNFQWMQRLFSGLIRKKKPSLDDWRAKLQEVSQKLHDEYDQLGRVQQLLLQQPRIEEQANLSRPSEQEEWNEQAKVLLQDIIRRRWSQVDPSKTASENREETIGMDLKALQESSWNESKWEISLSLVGNSKNRRRLQKRGSNSLQTLNPVRKNLVKYLDWHGIPSAFLKIAIARAVHVTLAPHWPQIKAIGFQVGSAVWGIIHFRFYTPLKVIALDLLNRRPRLLDPKHLQIEQESYLNMLRNLGIDVDKMDKAVAQKVAAQMYEDQLKRGTVRNMIFGKTVQHILSQVQLLKAELLEAFQSIDELVDVNRLNVSLLATIPAFLLVRWGSRMLYSLMYRLRAQNVSGLKDAHQEMINLLRELERILILAEESQLSSAELGAFISHEQKYLLLLDICQPPLPAKQVDSIYKDVQDFLPCGGALNTETQLNLLKLIQEKNAE
eukprot:CAMPEP_0194201414 /NCGR_PEP_ID=MMETSP0156-20130528/1690_1 /TAXON_ID=33649 /ORGANISM="Thalassionema nitzschioides, Strain L26-B" /LENGTH=632 /DNA_ID=CAMNT_0038926597 /DNA_START=499 /DNA_END=2394 /DNA_ORIENTATION=+